MKSDRHMQHWTMSSTNKRICPQQGLNSWPSEFMSGVIQMCYRGLLKKIGQYIYIFFMNSAIRTASWPHGLAEVTFVDLWPLLLENSGPTAHYFQRNSYLKLLWLFSSLSEEKFYFTLWSKILPHWVKKKVIFWFFKIFL